MAAPLPPLPRLPPGMINANSPCWSVIQGPHIGKVGRGDPIPGYPSFTIYAAGRERYLVNTADVQEVPGEQCAGVRLGRLLGGRRKKSIRRQRKTHRRSRSRRN